MRVNGRDVANGAYLVSIDAGGDCLSGRVPESLIAEGLRMGGGRAHQMAYDWIGANAAAIEDALRARRAGQTVAAPFDRIELVGED
ncbi:MAG: hypothetical protein AAF914_14610 [Pseudomonadota bacterium]